MSAPTKIAVSLNAPLTTTTSNYTVARNNVVNSHVWETVALCSDIDTVKKDTQRIDGLEERIRKLEEHIRKLEECQSRFFC